MRPKYYLFVIPLLLLSIFSCKKSDAPLSTEAVKDIKPPTVMTTNTEPPPHLRVLLDNFYGQAVFAKIDIVDGFSPMLPPILTKIINFEAQVIQPVKEIYFSIPDGTYYQVKITDHYGITHDGPTFTAVDGQQDIYPLRIDAPSVLPITDPNIPPPPLYDDRHNFPAIPNVTEPYTVIASSPVGGSPAMQVIILPEFSDTPYQTAALKYWHNGSWYYNTTAVFNIVPGYPIRVLVRGEDGSVVISDVRLSGYGGITM